MRAGGSDEGPREDAPRDEALRDEGPREDGQRASRRREALALTGVLTLVVGLASALPNIVFWAIFSMGSSFGRSDSDTGSGDEGLSWWYLTLALSVPVLIFGLALGLLSAFVALAARSISERRRTLPTWAAVLVLASAASLTVALFSALPLFLAEHEELRQASAIFSTTAGIAGWYYPLPLLAAVIAAAVTVARSRLRRMDAAPAASDTPPAPQTLTPYQSPPGLSMLARVTLTVGAAGALSPLWMAMLNGGIFAPPLALVEQNLPAFFTQIGLALATPLVAIVLAVLSLKRAAREATRSVTPSTQTATQGIDIWSRVAGLSSRVPWTRVGAGAPHSLRLPPFFRKPVLASLSHADLKRERSAAVAAIVLVSSVCVLAATGGMAAMRVAEVQQAIASRDRIAALSAPDLGNGTADPGNTGAPTAPAPAPTLEPEVPSTAMTPDEARLAMEQLIATTVEVITASASAPGSELRWLDASVASQSTGNDAYPQVPAPSAAIAQSCLDGAGVQYSMPSATFALGLITDTSSDDNDSEVIDANVATAERLVAAWTYLGYTEDSALGGNIEMAGPPDAAATSLGVRYGFGIASVKATGQCVADTR